MNFVDNAKGISLIVSDRRGVRCKHLDNLLNWFQIAIIDHTIAVHFMHVLLTTTTQFFRDTIQFQRKCIYDELESHSDR